MCNLKANTKSQEAIDKLDALNSDSLPSRMTVGAIVGYDPYKSEIVVRLKPSDLEKLDPENIAIVSLKW